MKKTSKASLQDNAINFDSHLAEVKATKEKKKTLPGELCKGKMPQIQKGDFRRATSTRLTSHSIQEELNKQPSTQRPASRS